MAWGAAIGGLAGLAGGLFGGSKEADASEANTKRQIAHLQAAAAKLEEDYAAALAGAGSGAFGSVPDAALYQPINLSRSQMDAVGANQSALGGINALTGGANNEQLRQDLARIQRLVPGYAATQENLGQAATSLSAGMLPFEDVQDIVSDRSSMAGAVNVPGGSVPATLRDLGMSRLSAINQGNSLFQSMIAGANSGVSPVQDQLRASNFFVSPQQQANLGLQQAQLVQQSQQNANDLAASPNPTSAGRLHLQLAGINNAASTRAQIAGLDSPTIPNYSSIYSTAGQLFGEGIGGLFDKEDTNRAVRV